MSMLPEGVTAKLSEENLRLVEVWWSELDAASRDEFGSLWDARSEDTAYCATIVDGKTEWHELPIELRAFPAGTHSEKENAMWKRQLGEYVNGHEVHFYLAEKTFHVCRAHACAREVGRTGVVPATFSCPFADAACPFERALDAARGPAGRRALWLVPMPRSKR
jgi:hypothetical protein